MTPRGSAFIRNKLRTAFSTDVARFRLSDGIAGCSWPSAATDAKIKTSTQRRIPEGLWHNLNPSGMVG
jgi:hypothetical protein